MSRSTPSRPTPATSSASSASPVERRLWSARGSSASCAELRGGHLLRLVPLRLRLGQRRVVVLLQLPVELLEVEPELLRRGPPPEPVADVDLLQFEPWRQDQRVRHPGVVVVRVRVLADVEVALHLEVLVRQEGPARAGRD